MTENEMRELTGHLLGLDKDSAIQWCRKLNLTCRISSIDGVAQILTMDLDFNRVNLKLEKNLVVGVTFG